MVADGDNPHQVRQGDPSASTSNRRPILFLSVAVFAAASMTRIMDSVLPQIADEFDVSIGAAGYIATAYALAYGTLQLLFGPLGDSFGKYRIILFATLGSAFTAYLCAFADTMQSIAVARFVSGAVAAAIVPLAIAWVGDVAPAGQRQQLLARFMSGQILGLLAGQLGGGILGQLLGWRSSFFVMGTVYVVAFAGMLAEYRRGIPTPRSPPSSLSKMGATLVSLGRRREVRFVLGMVFIEAFAMFGAFTYVGATLIERFGLNFGMVGIVLAAYCVGGLLYVWQSARLIGFFGPKRLACVGAAVVSTTYVVLAFGSTVWVVAIAIAIMGGGFYMLHNTLQTLATEMAPEARGSAVAVFATCYFLAQAIGVYVAGKGIDLAGSSAVFATSAAILIAQAVAVYFLMPKSFDRPGSIGR